MIENYQFLAFLVDLPEEVEDRLGEVDKDLIPYNGSEADHRTPHITVVPPRRKKDLNYWRGRIQERGTLPTEFRIERFGLLWDSGKLGFVGRLNSNVGIDAPHVTLIDTEEGDKEKARDVLRKYERNFSKFRGETLAIKSVAVIERGEGPIYTSSVRTTEKLDLYV